MLVRENASVPNSATRDNVIKEGCGWMGMANANSSGSPAPENSIASFSGACVLSHAMADDVLVRRGVGSI